MNNEQTNRPQRVHHSAARLINRDFLAPDYLNSAIVRNASICVLQSAKTIGRGNFAVAGPATWNSLLQCVRSAVTMASFWKQLKTNLIRLHYVPR